MLVSFIIPSYNSAHTVARCLDSIYALSLKSCEFEIIFIDDCSTDDTILLVKGYAQAHDNISLIRQPKNNRQGAARNRGVSIAKGHYICFVDSDDVVTKGIVTAIHLAQEKQTDMTAFHYANSNEQGLITRESKPLSFAKGQIFSGIEMQNKHPYWCAGPVAYVYSKEFLRRVNYPFREGVLYEDSDFISVHLYHARRMTYSKELGYIAYYREGSTTHSKNYRNIADYLLLGSRVLDFYKNIQKDIDQEKRNDKGIQKFADGILEGACHNVTMSAKRLFKLENISEIRHYYNRVDKYVNRRDLYSDKCLHKYPNYWNLLAYVGIRYKYVSIAINTCFAVLYRIYINFKNKR